MPVALETIGGFTIAAGGTLTQVTMAAGDSNQIRNFDSADGKRCVLLDVWKYSQSNGVLQITSPALGHGNVGLRFRDSFQSIDSLFGFGQFQSMKAQDNLTIQQSGSTVAGNIDNFAMTFLYDDLKGISATLIDVDTLRLLGSTQTTIEVSITAGTNGSWSGATSVTGANATQALVANTSYAILGITSDTDVCAIGVKGADTGNLRIAVPGNLNNKHYTGGYFLRLSQMYGFPLIPVFNSANGPGTMVDVLNNEHPATVVATLHLVKLTAMPG
jgi:hypothetical protein